MDFAIPTELDTCYAEIERFIDTEIAPLVARDDNIRCFDHRRYRITEGAEEIQMRKVAAYLFGYLGPRRAMFD